MLWPLTLSLKTSTVHMKANRPAGVAFLGLVSFRKS